ncbi:proline dehydrogenase [Sporobolomyces salmoneus]|uniref:proline dehydrogenase n=1 Tax=Sporobolomyces salmoneus TaxID=183962 RepID=UPI00317FC493
MYRNATRNVIRRITQPTRRPSSTTYHFESTASTSHPSTRTKALRYAGIGTLALGAGGIYLANTSSGLPLLPPPSYNSSDPLSCLDPSALSRTTAHLSGQTISDLCRQWIVFAISEQTTLVQAGPWMMAKIEWTRDNVPVLGKVVWEVFAFGMNQTFYRVFVGGETVPGCQETVDKYAEKGVGVMFNYSAEAPLGSSKPTSGIDHNCMREIHSAVIEAAKLTPPSPSTSSTTSSDSPAPTSSAIKPSLLAIKLTGLIYDASLLTRASNALTSSTSFQRGNSFSPSTNSEDSSDNFVFPSSPELSDEDHSQLSELYQGLRTVAREARRQGVRLLVDAEQSWYQPAIDHYADLLSQEFNKPDSNCSVPIVYNTYQCYLRTTPSKLSSALSHATSHNYSFGAKLVRGAYVESERKRHQQLRLTNVEEEDRNGEPCIVWDSKDETDQCYDQCATLIEKRIAGELRDPANNGNEGQEPKAQTGVCLASHNGTSMKKFLENLRKDGLVHVTEGEGRLQVDDRLRGRVAFGQLMGMSDNLTATLLSLLPPPPTPSSSSTSISSIPLVVKYVPYATVSQGLPYLIRRANENQSILKGDPTSGRGGAREERKAVAKEIRRRVGLSF